MIYDFFYSEKSANDINDISVNVIDLVFNKFKSLENNELYLMHFRNKIQWVDRIIKNYFNFNSLQKNILYIAAVCSNIHYTDKNLYVNHEDYSIYKEYNNDCAKNNLIITQKILEDLNCNDKFVEIIISIIQGDFKKLKHNHFELFLKIISDVKALSFFNIFIYVEFNKSFQTKESIFKRFKIEYDNISFNQKCYLLTFEYNNNIFNDAMRDLININKDEIYESLKNSNDIKVSIA